MVTMTREQVEALRRSLGLSTSAFAKLIKTNRTGYWEFQTGVRPARSNMSSVSNMCCILIPLLHATESDLIIQYTTTNTQHKKYTLHTAYA